MVENRDGGKPDGLIIRKSTMIMKNKKSIHDVYEWLNTKALGKGTYGEVKKVKHITTG
jgi:hypothetical protein